MKLISLILLPLTACASFAANLFPLDPPKTGSAAETYSSFIQHSGLAYTLNKSGRHREAEAQIELAAACLDLSLVPEQHRSDFGIETALMLREILDRTEVLDVTSIPTDAQKWRVAQTQFYIAPVTSGPRSGEFLFTTETVARIQQDFARVADLPYIRPDSNEEFYNWYLRTPGRFTTPSWLSWTAQLPDWSLVMICGQTLWQWAAIFVGAIVTAIFWFLGFKLYSVNLKSTRFWRHPFAIATPLLLALWTALVNDVLVSDVNVTGRPQEILQSVLKASQYGFLAWAAWVFIIRMVEITIQFICRGREPLDSTMVLGMLLAKIAASIVAFLILGYGFSRIGIPITGIVAGFGVGGLAFGLAAQPTLQNLIGSIMLLWDKPVKVGDFCDFDGVDGVVEEIGLRSTRIRTNNSQVTTVPNQEFSRAQITKKETISIIEKTIGLNYETSHEDIQRFLAGVHHILKVHPKIRPDFTVHFSGFGTSSLDFYIRAEVDTRQVAIFLMVQEEVLLEIMVLSKSLNIRFAGRH